MRCPCCYPCHSAAGSALLEVLVALLVVTTGMLGMASSQVRSLAGRAQDAEQLRGLRLAADAVALLRMVDPANRGAAPGAAVCDATAPCTAAQFAGSALSNWQQRVQRELPQGAAGLTLAADQAVVQIQLRWRPAAGGHRLVLESGL